MVAVWPERLRPQHAACVDEPYRTKGHVQTQLVSNHGSVARSSSLMAGLNPEDDAIDPQTVDNVDADGIDRQFGCVCQQAEGK